MTKGYDRRLCTIGGGYDLCTCHRTCRTREGLGMSLRCSGSERGFIRIQCWRVEGGVFAMAGLHAMATFGFGSALRLLRTEQGLSLGLTATAGPE